MVIYKITNDENDKVYVGRATNIPERWKEHLKECRKSRSKGRALYDAMNSIGKEKFHIRKIEECDKDEGYNSTETGK